MINKVNNNGNKMTSSENITVSLLSTVNIQYSIPLKGHIKTKLQLKAVKLSNILGLTMCDFLV